MYTLRLIANKSITSHRSNHNNQSSMFSTLFAQKSRSIRVAKFVHRLQKNITGSELDIQLCK